MHPETSPPAPGIPNPSKQSNQRTIRRRNQLIAWFPWLSKISEMRHLLIAAKRWRREGWFVPVPQFVRRAMLLSHSRAIEAEIFVETGTYKGGTTWCLLGEFHRIHTIEVVPELASLAMERFRKHPEVTVIQGDSATILPELCRKLDAPCLFYLDGHYSGGITGMGTEECPVVAELQAIFEHTAPPFRIIIDDARLFGKDPAYPNLETIHDFLKRQSILMHAHVENDAIVIY